MAEMDDLERKLAASKRMGHGYKDRIAAIEKRIAELQQQEGGDQAVVGGEGNG